MKNPRFPEQRNAARSSASDDLREDLEVLRSSTAENLPTLDETARMLRAHQPSRPREGLLMKLFNPIKARPLLTTGVGAVLLAALLLLVPVSYERTTGYDVQLGITTPGLAPSQVQAIAQQFQDLLETDQMSISNDQLSGATMLMTRLPADTPVDVEATVGAFARVLTSKGIEASAEVRPRIERITNNMLAYAAGRVIEITIDREGKSLAEIEEEIRVRLEEEGMLNPSVTVTESGGEMQIDISGEIPEGEHGSGEMQMDFEISSGAQGAAVRAAAKLDRSLSDDELRDEITRQLREQGLDAEVVVEDGKVVSATPR